jgi:cysteine desulfurase / selenocysteine lyase
VTVTAYLDHAGLGLLRPASTAAMRAALDDVLPHGSALIGPLFSTRPAARRSFARLLSCTPEEIALVPNTSTGVHLVADGLDWHRGDRVTVFDRDFPANVRPWQNLARHAVSLDWVPQRDGGYTPDDIAAAIGPNTRLIAVSHVNFATGFRCDLDQICALAAEAGALVFVDAVQSLGVLPLSVTDTPIDFLAAGAHKWLGAPPGTGMFYCRADRLDLLRSVPSGWFGFDGAADLMKGPGNLRYDLPERSSASRVEGGMYDILGMVGLAAALAELEEVGIQAVAERSLALARRVRYGVRRLGYTLACPDSAAEEQTSAITALRFSDSQAVELAAKLAAEGVYVSTPDGLVRISPHYWTRDEEVDLFLEHLSAL